MEFTFTRSLPSGLCRTTGCRRGTIRYVILRDCVTEAVATMGELDLAALSEVSVSGGGLG